jgi:hypothetical protein
MKIGRLYIGVMKTNEDHRKILASWQHKDGYWRWCLSWYPTSRGFALVRPGYIDGHYTPGGWTSVWRGLFRGHFSCWGTLPFGGWGFSTQPPWPRKPLQGS